ncbi:MAG: ester cyclase [Dehalococcoidia bacterium]
MQQTGVPAVDGIFQALGNHDAAAMSRFYQQGARVWMVGIKNEKGVGGFETHAKLLAAMPDMALEIHSCAAADDTVFVEWTRTGTHSGQFENLAPTNNAVSLRGVSVFTVAGSKVTEERIYLDSQDLYGQLSVPRKRSSAVRA